MHHQGEGSRIVLIHAKANQRRDDHEMPRTDTTLHRDRHTDATHGESDQTHPYAQLTGEVERIEGDIEITEVATPDQQGLHQEEPLLIHQPDTLHARPHVQQQLLGLTYQREVTHVFEHEPDHDRQPDHQGIDPNGVEHRMEPLQQSRVLGEETDEKVEVKDNPLNGIKFCITGSFSQSRDKLREQLEDKGAKFVSGVSKNLDILFCGEKAGSKLTKAQNLGVRVAYEDELMKLLGE